ncbi:MAG: hypothetical protein JSW12_02615 [Deltaproteobacteria bacterium]|nr:MAG: hypothetical protein JSW12_02615 [Deltaproteobacteria bacterium]
MGLKELLKRAAILKTLSFLTVFLLLSLPARSAEPQVTINLENTSEYIKVARVYHVDHPYRDTLPGPFEIGGGEIEPGETWALSRKNSPGIYIFCWGISGREHVDRERKCETISIPADISKITVNDEHEVILE